ncbi:hypothetical protein BH11MYX1_BH11MYX1_11120 [soil metagenome]
MALVVLLVVIGLAGLFTSVRGLNKPPDRRRPFMLAGVALTIVAAAGFLLLLGLA